MHMLADSVEVARRRRHPQAQSHRGDAAALGPPDPGADRRGRRPPPGHPGAGASLATRPAHPNRGRPDRGRHRAVRLVPPWPLPLRRGVRHAGRGRPHPRLLWPDRPGSTQPLWDRQLNQALYTVELLATVALSVRAHGAAGAGVADQPQQRVPRCSRTARCAGSTPPVGAAITAGFRWAGVGWGGPPGPAAPAWPARPPTAGWRQRPRGRPGPARRCRAGWAGRGREEPS
jgi:hypothetical protein